MKKFIRVLSVLLALFMIFSVVGCGSSEEEKKEESQPEKKESGEVLPIVPSETTPIDVDYTDSDLIVDGESVYSIVLPENYGDNEMYAAQEVRTFLYKSCGNELEIKYDNAVDYTAESKIIAIGNVKYLGTVGIRPDYNTLGKYGFILKTVGDSVFIVGATADGTGALNGAYEFLHYQIGFECYAQDEIKYTKSESIKLVDVDITDTPDIPGYIGSSYITTRPDYMRRLRVNKRVDVLGLGKTSPYHNFLSWLPTEEYKSKHPDWYNSKDTQLCLTAHGNQAEYQAMVDTVFERMYKEVETYDLNIVTFTLMDNFDYCTCSACQQSEQQYGAKSGQLVKFCNELSDKFKHKYQAEHNERDLSILFFAYYYYTNPPTKGITCNDNVYPIIAPYNEMDRAASIYDVKNANIKGIIDNWSEICNRFGFWIYSANFAVSYLVPWDPFSNLQENYTYFASKDPIYMFDEGFTGQYAENVSCFTALKEYLSAKIAWDNKVNVTNLINDFFVNYFKDAATDMYNLFNAYRLKLQILFEEYDYTHSSNDVLKPDYWEHGTLLLWKQYIDNAYKAIEKYRSTDPELFTKLDIRIRTESITVNYMILKMFGMRYSDSEQERMLNDLYNDTVKVRLLTGSHWKPVEILLGIED